MPDNSGRLWIGVLIFLLEALACRKSLDYFQRGMLALASADCQTLETRQHFQ
jgi:hypothetical protein